MRFGMSEQEANEQPSRGGGGGFIKYPKEGGNQVRILDEPDQWKYFWEHFNPGGYSFPCNTEDRGNCPGCTSDIEKMQKASEKVAMNCYDGQYTSVWKFPRKSVADKLKTRYERIGTITDRDYLITQIKSKKGVEYDLEGLDKEAFDFDAVEEYKKDPEELLAEAYEDAWGGDAKSRTAVAADAVQQQHEADAKPVRPTIKREEPKEETTVSEKDLRAMDVWDLEKLCKSEGFGAIPKGLDTSDQIVDWMLEQG